MANAKFIYQHDHKCPNQPVDAHHIAVQGGGRSALVIFFSALIFAGLLSVVLAKERSSGLLLWSFPLGIFLLKSLQLKPVKKESVLIMPGFGVQLETHYRSGRTSRRFVPINKILKSVLQECVTPVTCYWCLSLVLRDEDELMLVFKEVHPPLKMLVPVWKALCNAVNEAAQKTVDGLG